jgi:hypothetical protein
LIIFVEILSEIFFWFIQRHDRTEHTQNSQLLAWQVLHKHEGILHFLNKFKGVQNCDMPITQNKL